MNQFFVGNTLINDAYLGSIRVDDLIAFKQPMFIEYLIVGGGGAGGAGNGGGGGGGGFVTGSLSLAAGTYEVIIGNGGASTGGAYAKGPNGKNSWFNNVSASGGGGGGSAFVGGTGPLSGSNGGSGGGAAGPTDTLDIRGGTGSLGQGFNGGGVKFSTSDLYQASGGGGGAGAAAVKATNYITPTAGGNGKAWLDGVTYAGGGGPVGGAGSTSGGNGGTGGGGKGGSPITFAQSGSNDLGGGGGGASRNDGGNNTAGGSGIVKIRYAGTGSRATGGRISFSNGYTYHTFIASDLVGTDNTGSFIY